MGQVTTSPFTRSGLLEEREQLLELELLELETAAAVRARDELGLRPPGAAAAVHCAWSTKLTRQELPGQELSRRELPHAGGLRVTVRFPCAS